MQVMAQANAAVKTMCPQSVFITCCGSEEGTVWEASMNEANEVTL